MAAKEGNANSHVLFKPSRPLPMNATVKCILENIPSDEGSLSLVAETSTFYTRGPLEVKNCFIVNSSIDNASFTLNFNYDIVKNQNLEELVRFFLF